MAKTASQIKAENKKRNEKIQQVVEYSKAVDANNAEQFQESAAKTQAVLEKAVSGTSDSAKKTDINNAVKLLTAEYKKSGHKTATDMQKKKEDRLAAKNPVNSAEIKKKTAEKQLSDFEERNANLDWTDATAREQYENQRRRLQAEVDSAGQEMARQEDAQWQAADTAEMEAMPEEDKKILEQYAVNQVRDQNLPVEMVGRMPTAQQEAASLIEKYGKQRVDELAETYMRQQNEALAKQTEEKAKQLGKDHWIASSLATIPVSALNGIVGTVGQLQGAARSTGRYSTLDPHATGTVGDTFVGAVRGQVAQDAEEKHGWLASAGYQGIMSLADTVARGFLGGGAFGGAALAATSSFSQTMADAAKQGATPAQAALLATATAGIEALTEKLPLDELIKTAKGGNAAGIIKNVVRQAGIEIMEEEASLLGTLLAEAAILQEKSGYHQNVSAKILLGQSPEEARKEAAEEIFWEAVNTALVSGISGAGGGMGSAAVNQIRNNAQSKPGTRAELMAKTAVQQAKTEAQQAQEAVDMTMEEAAKRVPQATPAPLTEGQQHMVNATAMVNGLEPEAQKTPQIEFTTNAVSNPVDSYPPEKQKSIRSYLQSVDQGIKDFVQKVKSGDKTFKRQKISNVSDRAVQDIGNLLGVDAHGYTHNINTGGVQHIINRHGVNGEHDNTMSSDDDIARVGWVLENYDNVELVTENGKQVFSKEFKDANNNPAPQIRFVKKIDGSYYVVEAACENKYKKLWVQSAYLQKNNGDVTQVSTADPSASHATNAQGELASPSPMNIIPETAQNVNGNPVSGSDYYDEFENWGNDPNQEGVEDPLADRSYSEAGKRSVKAYMYENPAVRPFFQEQAAWLLSELADSTKGERTYSEQLHYESGGEQGWTGTKRHTSESIAKLLDQNGMTYDQIQRGLNAIVNDHGQENNAVSKRIEFVINDRLMNGYTDFYTGERVSGNAEYLDLLRNQQSAPTADMQMDASNQSAEGGQIKGTGAAEHNFSGKPAYNATLAEDNAQPDRENDVRPMELPATDVNGGNISAATANVYGSQNTPDDLAAAMEEPAARGDYSYIRISNDAATQRAQETIGRAGSWEEARLNFRSDVEGGNAGAEISARGALILNHAAEVYQQAKNSGNMQAAERAKKEWLGVLADIQKLSTNTAQGLQALKIIRNLMPQDKIEFARIAVQNMVRDMRLKTDIQIDEQLLMDYENATTDQQRDEIMEKIQQNVADQIPSTLLDKWNALRYTNMLGNLKTTGRNIFGNAANTAIYRFKDSVGAAVEAIANNVSDGKVGRTKSVIVNKNIQKACADYYQQVKNTIGSGGKYNDSGVAFGDFAQGVMDKRTIFKFKPLEDYRKATNWMMNNKKFGDEAFGKAAFTHAMAGYLQANGIKSEADVKNASPDLIDKAVSYAVQEAQETTFHDNIAFANVLGKLKKTTGIVGEGIMPFTKTPANVLVRAEEYSPLGIINTAVLSAQKLAGNTKLADANGHLGDWAAKGQDITGTDIINSLSKTLTGAGIFALGAILKSHGILNGGPDDDEDQASFDKMNGIQPYSINLPNGSTYTLDWLTPVAMPLFMGAQFMDIAEEKDLTFADLEDVFTSIADPMIQMSMMQGINSSLEDIKYSGNNMGQFFLNAAVSYLTQGLTNTLLGQLERSTEEYRQTTYIDQNSQVPQWMQKALGKASQKVPGWDYQQTDYIDAWGEKQKNDGGMIYNLLSPGYYSEKKNDPLTTELNRLREATGEDIFPETARKTVTYTDKDGNLHKDQPLTEEQYQTLATTQGQTAKRIVSDIMDNANYKAMTDEQKAKTIDLAYSYAKKTAEIETFKEDHTGYEDSWMMEMDEGKEASYIINRVANSEISKAVSALDTAWDRGYNDSTRSADLEEAYDSYAALDKAAKATVQEFATGTARKYIEARDNGMDHEDVLAAIKNVAKVTGTGSVNKDTGKKTVRDIDRREAIARTTGLTVKEIDIVMKAYMPDYDPSGESPETTEFKYQYAREELGLSPSEYTETYRAFLDADKKRDKIAAMTDLGYDRKVVNILYKLYGGGLKKTLIEMYG